MTPEQRKAIKDLIAKHKEKCLADPEYSRHWLINVLGTHNKDGSLCKEYGGTYTDVDHPVHNNK